MKRVGLSHHHYSNLHHHHNQWEHSSPASISTFPFLCISTFPFFFTFSLLLEQWLPIHLVFAFVFAVRSPLPYVFPALLTLHAPPSPLSQSSHQSLHTSFTLRPMCIIFILGGSSDFICIITLVRSSRKNLIVSFSICLKFGWGTRFSFLLHLINCYMQ